MNPEKKSAVLAVKFVEIPRSMKILRVDLDPQKLVPTEKKTREIKRRKN